MTYVSKITAASPMLWFGNTLVSIVVPSTEGADQLCAIEHWMPFGDSPPRHLHRNEDEMFHIISGTLRFEVGGKTLTATAGETVLAPKGVPHSYRVESTDGAHVLTLTRGRDFESMVRSAARPAASAELPPASAPTAEMVTQLTALCAANHIDIVGPPLS